jgi:hypothetical protein
MSQPSDLPLTPVTPLDAACNAVLNVTADLCAGTPAHDCRYEQRAARLVVNALIANPHARLAVVALSAERAQAIIRYVSLILHHQEVAVWLPAWASVVARGSNWLVYGDALVELVSFLHTRLPSVFAIHINEKRSFYPARFDGIVIASSLPFLPPGLAIDLADGGDVIMLAPTRTP